MAGALALAAGSSTTKEPATPEPANPKRGGSQRGSAPQRGPQAGPPTTTGAASTVAGPGATGPGATSAAGPGTRGTPRSGAPGTERPGGRAAPGPMAGPDSPAAAVPRRTAGAPPLPARPGARPAPRLTPIRHVLPDGVFHGYLYTTPGARKCRPTLPTGRCVRCAIHRGRSKGCGDTVFRNRPTILCLQGVYRQCQVGGDGTVKRCGGVYSGWTITHRRGVLRRCCIRQGKVKYCTNAADYVCTPAERR